MNEKVNLNANSPTTPLFERAKSLAEQANIHPRQVMNKVFRLQGVLSVSIVFTLVILIVIRLGWPQSQNAKNLTALVLLMSIITSVAAVIGLFMLLWTAFVISYVHIIEQEARILDESDVPAPEIPLISLDDLRTASGEYQRTGAVPLSGRSFWFNAATVLSPVMFIGVLTLAIYFVLGQMFPSVNWSFYLISVIPLMLAVYTGIKFYLSNPDSYYVSRRDRRFFRPTILFSNFDQAQARFAGLMLAIVMSVTSVYILNSKEHAKKEYRDVSLAYARESLEKVAVQSIKEKRLTGEFITPQADIVQGLDINTEQKPEKKQIIYRAKTRGLEDGFIAVVTADSGNLYLSTENTLGDIGTKDFKTNFVVGTVKDVDEAKGEFVLTVLNPTDGQKEIRIKLTELVSQPTTGTDIVVAMDPQQMEARRIEEISDESKTKEGAASGGMAMSQPRLLRVFGAKGVSGELKNASLVQRVP